MWRFWRALPPKGKIGIFFGSWYTDPILGRVAGTTQRRSSSTSAWSEIAPLRADARRTRARCS